MDASLMEINPFLLTKDSRLIALDAKVNFRRQRHVPA